MIWLQSKPLHEAREKIMFDKNTKNTSFVKFGKSCGTSQLAEISCKQQSFHAGVLYTFSRSLWFLAMSLQSYFFLRLFQLVARESLVTTKTSQPLRQVCLMASHFRLLLKKRTRYPVVYILTKGSAKQTPCVSRVYF